MGGRHIFETKKSPECRSLLDAGPAGCQIPQGVVHGSNGNTWKPFELYVTDRYDNRANQYNVFTLPSSIEVRIHMTPNDNSALGILEVQVAFEE